MGRLVFIFVFAFLTAGAAMGDAYPTHAPDVHTTVPSANQETPDQDDSRTAGQPLSEMPTEDSEEEVEDKDETSKEKVPQRITTLNLTTLLELLYTRQLLVFGEHHPEVDTPPPRF